MFCRFAYRITMESCTLTPSIAAVAVTGGGGGQLYVEADAPKDRSSSACTSDTDTPKPPTAPTEFHVFMDLPNELIVKLMSYFGSSENIILSRLNSRLHSLYSSPPCQRVWKKIVINDAINKHDTFRYLKSFVTGETESICIMSRINGSNHGCTSSLPPRLFTVGHLVPPYLAKLKLIGQRFDEKIPNIFALLPPTLKSLDLSRTFINVVKFENMPNDEQPINIDHSFSYFQGIDKCLPQLESLKLNSCVWLLPFDLVHIRRLERLKKFSISGCKLSDHLSRTSGKGVHYVEPIAIRRVQWRRIFSWLQGEFCNLEVLDITNTDINRNGMLSTLIPMGFRVTDAEENEKLPPIPIRVLKLGYYDCDYVWSLMGDTINLSLLERAENLEILDISGFYLETAAPGVRRTRIGSVGELEGTLQCFNPNLKEVCVHFCKLRDSPGLKDSLKRKIPSGDGDEAHGLESESESVAIKKAMTFKKPVYHLS